MKICKNFKFRKFESVLYSTAGSMPLSTTHTRYGLVLHVKVHIQIPPDQIHRPHICSTLVGTASPNTFAGTKTVPAATTCLVAPVTEVAEHPQKNSQVNLQ